MKKETIAISIGRQFGSGGAEIAEKLSLILNIPMYNKELLSKASMESGLSEEAFESADEQIVSSLSYGLPMAYSYLSGYIGFADIMSKENYFLLQCETIQNIAKDSCIIVGRCADYILRNQQNCISFFIHSNMETRKKKVSNSLGISREKTEELIESIDKQRAAYYNFYTNKQWGMAASYDFCIDASLMGIEKTAELIATIVKNIKNKEKN